MTGRSPQPSRRTSGLYRLATERPIARRTAALAAAVLSGSALAGCVKTRQTRPGTVERVVPGSDEAEREFTGFYVVGQNFDSVDVTIDEHSDRIVLALDITTAGGDEAEASGREQSFAVELASPRRNRPFVDRDGKEIPVAEK